MLNSTEKFILTRIKGLKNDFNEKKLDNNIILEKIRVEVDEKNKAAYRSSK